MAHRNVASCGLSFEIHGQRPAHVVSRAGAVEVPEAVVLPCLHDPPPRSEGTSRSAAEALTPNLYRDPRAALGASPPACTPCTASTLQQATQDAATFIWAGNTLWNMVVSRHSRSCQCCAGTVTCHTGGACPDDGSVLLNSDVSECTTPQAPCAPLSRRLHGNPALLFKLRMEPGSDLLRPASWAAAGNPAGETAFLSVGDNVVVPQEQRRL